ncbi:MAG: host attachment protein [Myxococcales bacterium]|nr:host attachment protein [Myxococcales bacterium]USN50925.1 MAG: host attachment protein [Myxococcales bacterium]
MITTWVLIAHGDAAKILEIKKNGHEISRIKELIHPQTAMKDVDIHTDRPGRSFESANSARHALDYNEDPTDHERKVFAQEIAEFLAQAFDTGRFAKLILVSSPHLLGNIRKSLKEPIKKIIAHELSKDLMALDLKDHELIEKIRTALGIIAF